MASLAFCRAMLEYFPNAMSQRWRRIDGAECLSQPRESLADFPFAERVSVERSARRSGRRPDACGDRHSRADGYRAAWRLLAADRLFRLCRGIAGICHVWQQSLPVVRRRFHHHAHFRRRACADGRLRLSRLSGARGGAGAVGRRDPGGRQPVSARVDRQFAIDAGDNRFSSPASPCTSWSRKCPACWGLSAPKGPMLDRIGETGAAR